MGGGRLEFSDLHITPMYGRLIVAFGYCSPCNLAHEPPAPYRKLIRLFNVHVRAGTEPGPYMDRHTPVAILTHVSL